MRSERDPKAAQESFDAFKELATKFPDSKYAADATARMKYLVNALASHQVHEIGTRSQGSAGIFRRIQGVGHQVPRQQVCRRRHGAHEISGQRPGIASSA